MEVPRGMVICGAIFRSRGEVNIKITGSDKTQTGNVIYTDGNNLKIAGNATYYNVDRRGHSLLVELCANIGILCGSHSSH